MKNKFQKIVSLVGIGLLSILGFGVVAHAADGDVQVQAQNDNKQQLSNSQLNYFEVVERLKQYFLEHREEIDFLFVNI